MQIKHTLLVAFLFFISGTILGQNQYQITDSSLFRHARELCSKYILLDSHNDLPGWLYDKWFDVSVNSGQGQIDYPRAMEGGLDAVFLAVFTPPSIEGTGKAKAEADSILKLVFKIESEWPDKFKIVTSSSDLKNEADKGKLVIAIGMENGSPIENNIKNVEEFYNKGVRYITLCHFKWNHICDSSTDPEKKWNGLSLFGEEVVKEMNRLGLIIDVSHISDSAFYDVIKLSKVPVIASHSCLRYFIPEYDRNISDDMVKTLAQHGGVLQINFAGMFLVDSLYQNFERADTIINNYLKDNNISHDSSAAWEYSDKYYKEHPMGYATVKDVADQIDHVVKLVGIDYVGIGSDFNGVSSLPVGLEDVSKYPNLVYELLTRGYTDDDIEKILGGNFLRVWEKVEKGAK